MTDISPPSNTRNLTIVRTKLRLDEMAADLERSLAALADVVVALDDRTLPLDLWDTLHGVDLVADSVRLVRRNVDSLLRLAIEMSGGGEP